MTRRAFPLMLPAGLLLAQDVTISGTTSLVHSDSNVFPAGDDTWVAIIEASPTSFFIGVRSSVKADRALVTVFYRQPLPSPQGPGVTFTVKRELMLTLESMAPIAGPDAYGVTRDPFAIPRDQVTRIEVAFLNDVTSRRVDVK